MITKETSAKIWNAYNEIDKANKLLSELNEKIANTGNVNFIDAFGRETLLQLGVPTGPASHTLYEVRAELAVQVINEHIKSKENELLALQEVAFNEMLEKMKPATLRFNYPIVKRLGTAGNIGALKALISSYPKTTSFGFRNQPMQALYEVAYNDETFVVFDDLEPKELQ